MKIVGIVALLLIGGLALRLILMPFGFAHRAIDVAQQELDPAVLLKRYAWFKDASAALDKKSADMQVYDRRIANLREDYEGVPRGEWAREDREQLSIWQSESAGIRASYNSLAAEYNAQMAKLNWRFTNAGMVPQGGVPLPREYRLYVVD